MGSFPSEYKDDSEKSAGLLFMRAFSAWHSEIKRQLREVPLTHPQFVVLASLSYLLQGEEAVTQVMIAHVSGMDVMSVSQVLGLLERDGFINRQPHPHDSRANAVLMTERGTKALQRAVPLVERIDERFFGSLGQKKQDFIKMLRQLGTTDFKTTP